MVLIHLKKAMKVTSSIMSTNHSSQLVEVTAGDNLQFKSSRS